MKTTRAAAKTATKSLLDCPALHFNWGFRDARAEQSRGKVRDVSGHFDAAYADGYRAGLTATGTPIPANSPMFDGWD